MEEVALRQGMYEVIANMENNPNESRKAGYADPILSHLQEYAEEEGFSVDLRGRYGYDEITNRQWDFVIRQAGNVVGIFKLKTLNRSIAKNVSNSIKDTLCLNVYNVVTMHSVISVSEDITTGEVLTPAIITKMMNSVVDAHKYADVVSLDLVNPRTEVALSPEELSLYVKFQEFIGKLKEKSLVQ